MRRNILQQAASSDPTGYYGIRGAQLVDRQSPFPKSINADLSVDLAADKLIADQWMITAFNLDPSTNLSSFVDLTSFPKFLRGQEYTKLGLRDSARKEFDSLREELIKDPLKYISFIKLPRSTTSITRPQSSAAGKYWTRQVSARNKLYPTLQNTSTISGLAFSSEKSLFLQRMKMILILYLLFSVIRQESLFEPAISSSADARGLMQILPAVGAEIATNFGWPPDFKTSDLDRPCDQRPTGGQLSQKMD